jgi:hypothetical protein
MREVAIPLLSDRAYQIFAAQRTSDTVDDLIQRLNAAVQRYANSAQFEQRSYSNGPIRIESYPIHNLFGDGNGHLPGNNHQTDITYRLDIDPLFRTISLEVSPESISVPSYISRDQLSRIRQQWESFREANIEIDRVVQEFASTVGFSYSSPFSYFKAPQGQLSLPGMERI